MIVRARMWGAVAVGLVCIAMGVFLQSCFLFNHIPEGLESITADDQTTWEQVNRDGFGSDENMAVVAMQGYKGRLYALVRNDAEGVEVWRTNGTSWQQVPFNDGYTNGIYGNHMINTHMGAMIVFKDKLYCGFSSGIQGNYLKSSGLEIWRYDGMAWEPVISDKKDKEESGRITGISGCDDSDAETTALLTDSSKSWQPEQWTGGVLQITSGQGRFRRFDIIGNTSDTLVIQQNEIAGEQGTEYTVCDSKHYVNPFPPHQYDLGPVTVGDSYEIGTGSDENGFGDYFNKCITTLVVFDGKLYANTTLNYDYGGQVWYTEDGDTWTVTQPERSMGLFHVDPNYVDSRRPVTRGIPSLCGCDVSGSDVLYAGTLGNAGPGEAGTPANLGSCARLGKLTDTGWELLVDSSVDANDTGTNENGFGGGLDCSMFNGNFMVWNLACFKKMLFAGFQTLNGARVMYTTTGGPEDGSWRYSVGGNGSLPNGFDGEINPGADVGGETLYQTIAVNLYPFGNYLYAGAIRVYMPEFGATEEFLLGSQIWKTADGITWELVTGDGFGDLTVLTFEAFAEFNGTLYVAASRAANTVGGGLGGAKIFRLQGGTE